jgi:hypothetical protein
MAPCKTEYHESACGAAAGSTIISETAPELPFRARRYSLIGLNSECGDRSHAAI